jgi:nucleoside-diphosphate-sugar epimerase
MYKLPNSNHTSIFCREDLSQIELILNQLKNKKIFITGGTGYMGKCLLDLLLHSNKEFNLNLHITLLTRSIKKFQSIFPLECDSNLLTFIESDIRESFTAKITDYDFIIHAATTAASTEILDLLKNQPTEILKTITEGTEQILNICKKNKNTRCLYISSGAVYQNTHKEQGLEENEWKSSVEIPLNTDSYVLGKRIAEKKFFDAYFDKEFKNFSIARCFSFIGPYLPLGLHLTGSNFFTNISRNEPLIINGYGDELRSFMHSHDLAIWLVAILLQGKPGRIYNVGSNEAVIIKDLAKKISLLFNNHPIVIKGLPTHGISKKYYLPNTDRAFLELNLNMKYKLDQALKNSAQWYGLLHT